MQKKLAAMLCALGTASAYAQDRPASPAATAKPAPMPPYASAFRDYRPYAEPETVRWREANDEVGRLGGHIGHVPGSAPPKAIQPGKPPAQGERR